MSLGLIRSSTRNIASVYSQDIDIQNYLKSNNLKANILKFNGISGKNGPPREVRDYIIKNKVHTIFMTTLDRFSSSFANNKPAHASFEFIIAP